MRVYEHVFDLKLANVQQSGGLSNIPNSVGHQGVAYPRGWGGVVASLSIMWCGILMAWVEGLTDGLLADHLRHTHTQETNQHEQDHEHHEHHEQGHRHHGC